MKDMNEFEGDVELLVNGTETLFIDGSNLAKVHSSKFQSVFKNEDEVETESSLKINAEVVLDGDGNEYKQDFYSPTPGVTVEVISNTLTRIDPSSLDEENEFQEGDEYDFD